MSQEFAFSCLWRADTTVRPFPLPILWGQMKRSAQHGQRIWGEFFSDLKSFGIQRITPTPVFDPWSGTAAAAQTQYVATCGIYKWLTFYPWLPYALDPGNSFPERTCGNNSYYGNTGNNVNFWGWNRFFNLVDTILLKAQAAALSVDAFDYFQESNLEFTVEGRMIYDNISNVDVLQGVRDRMAAHGFSPLRAAPSANFPPTPTDPSSDCGSFYGDSAMLMNLSELAAGIAGPSAQIGVAPHGKCFTQAVTQGD